MRVVLSSKFLLSLEISTRCGGTGLKSQIHRKQRLGRLQFEASSGKKIQQDPISTDMLGTVVHVGIEAHIGRS
jgi:hypothetical protein